MVDGLGHDTDNQVDHQGGRVAGWELAVLLLGGFRTLVDAMHALLAQRGHPGARPVHGFALQAIGSGATASEVALRLGVTKQAAAKTLGRLEQDGYVARSTDPADARRKIVVPTARGHDLLRECARAFEEVVAGWRARVGDAAVDTVGETLAALGAAGSDPSRIGRLDVAAWSG